MQRNKSPRVAVVGLYRSGSSAVAGLLHHLGFDMGAPFWGDYFEPFDLSARLRDWWNEPHLRQSFVDDDAVESLRAWEASRGVDATGLGAKHPLLSLMTNHLRQAWGPETKFIWAARDFERSCRSLERLGWWQNALEIQRLLWEALLQFRQQYDHLEVQHEAVLANPHEQLHRIVDFLEVDCPASVIEQAASTIRTPHVKAGAASSAAKKRRTATCTVPSCKLVATMLCGNNENMIAEAISSVVDWVDELLLIDTGVTDRSLSRAAENAKDKLVVTQLQWVNDFAAARNAALRFAEQRGADWCITIDTDERLVFPPNISREDWVASICADPGITAWLVTDRKMGYAKERIFRLPCQDEWRGRREKIRDKASGTPCIATSSIGNHSVAEEADASARW